MNILEFIPHIPIWTLSMFFDMSEDLYWDTPWSCMRLTKSLYLYWDILWSSIIFLFYHISIWRLSMNLWYVWRSILRYSLILAHREWFISILRYSMILNSIPFLSKIYMKIVYESLICLKIYIKVFSDSSMWLL